MGLRFSPWGLRFSPGGLRFSPEDLRFSPARVFVLETPGPEEHSQGATQHEEQKQICLTGTIQQKGGRYQEQE